MTKRAALSRGLGACLRAVPQEGQDPGLYTPACPSQREACSGDMAPPQGDQPSGVPGTQGFCIETFRAQAGNALCKLVRVGHPTLWSFWGPLAHAEFASVAREQP